MKNQIIAAALFSLCVPCAFQPAHASLPFDTSSGMVVISIRLKDKEIKALVDTGANVNAVDQSLAALIDGDGQTKELNFSDRGGVKAKTGTAEFTIDGKSYSMPVVATKTRVTKECCDALLGKPFFEQSAVLFDFEKSTLTIAPTELPKTKQHTFQITRGEKEILIPCTANGRATKARLDLGSQQALDVTGEFAAGLKLLDNPDTVFLDSVLQPQIGLARVEAKCGSMKLDPETPALVHPVSKTGLGHGEAGLNIGAPYLKRYHWLLDLPKSKVVFFERSPLPPVAFNPLHAFFTTDPERHVVVKAVLAGSHGQDLGLKVGDRVMKINDADIVGVEQAYALAEANPFQNMRIQIERDGQTLTLDGRAKSLFPHKTPFPQSRYGFSQVKPAASPVTPLKLESVKYVRFMYHQIEADFSLARLLDGVAVRDLLFRPFLSNVKMTNGSIFFDGLSVSTTGEIKGDLKHSMPSLAFECKSQRIIVSPTWVTPSILEATETIQGCGRTLVLRGAYYLEASEPPQELSETPSAPFLFLHDKQTGHRAKWNKKELTLKLDTGAPSWAQALLEEAIAEYNTVLSPQLTLRLEKASLSDVPLSSPDVIGVYWTANGHPFDAETRFAQARVVQNPETGEIQDADLMLRAPEFLQHEMLVQKIATEAAAGATPEAKVKFEKFAEEKIRSMRKNVLIHELGHLLGLAHNFSDKEKSVMSYATITSLSDYDRAALKNLYFNEAPSRAFELKAEPAVLQSGGFD